MGKLQKFFSLERIVFIGVFLLLVLIGKHINFSPLIGADNQFFTLFQFFGPLAGGFLGPLAGGIAVLGAQIFNNVFVGVEWTWMTVIRLLPMLLAAYYFSTRSKRWANIVFPVLAMGIFFLHPVGQTVPVFLLYWMIPVIIAVLPLKFSNNLFLKSLGATFAAHAVGSAAWAWAVPMTTEAWMVVFSVAWYERLVFAAGIAGSYLVVNALLTPLVQKWKQLHNVLFVNRRLTIVKAK